MGEAEMEEIEGCNHWNDEGDFVVEEKTLLRQVGWQGHNNHAFYAMGGEATCRRDNRGGYSPIFAIVATWVDGEGWKD